MKAKQVYKAEDLIISKWEDLTPTQALKVVPYAFNDDSNEVDLLKLLFKKKRILRKLDKYQVYEILSFTEWVSSSSFSKNLVPVYKIGMSTFYGPETGLGNVSLIEFAKADNCYLRYIQTKEETYLEAMIAALYRPAKSFWFIKKHFNRGKDIRKHFNSEILMEEARKFKKARREFKQYAILWFIGCKESLYSTYSELFNSTEEKGHKNKPVHEKKFGWAGIIYDLAETPVFAGIEAAKEANLHTALIYLNKKAIDNLNALNNQTNKNENQKY